MAFADDLVLAASTPDGLRELLDGLQVCLAARGLLLNPSKCVTIALQPDAKEKKTKTLTDPFCSIGGVLVPCVDTSTVWKYLGIKFNALKIQATPILEQVKEYLRSFQGSAETTTTHRRSP